METDSCRDSHCGIGTSGEEAVCPYALVSRPTRSRRDPRSWKPYVAPGRAQVPNRVELRPDRISGTERGRLDPAGHRIQAGAVMRCGCSRVVRTSRTRWPPLLGSHRGLRRGRGEGPSRRPGAPSWSVGCGRCRTGRSRRRSRPGREAGPFADRPRPRKALGPFRPRSFVAPLRASPSAPFTTEYAGILGSDNGGECGGNYRRVNAATSGVRRKRVEFERVGTVSGALS